MKFLHTLIQSTAEPFTQSQAGNPLRSEVRPTELWITVTEKAKFFLETRKLKKILFVNI